MIPLHYMRQCFRAPCTRMLCVARANRTKRMGPPGQSAWRAQRRMAEHGSERRERQVLIKATTARLWNACSTMRFPRFVGRFAFLSLAQRPDDTNAVI